MKTNLTPEQSQKLKKVLKKIFHQKANKSLFNRFQKVIQAYLKKHKIDPGQSKKYQAHKRLSQKTAIFITYADLILKQNQKHFQALDRFANQYLKNKFDTIHILPFYPYSSDRGFSVLDYEKVNPSAGDWTHVKKLGKNFKLMFDFVLNHMSAQGKWFKMFLDQKPGFENFFIHFKTKNAISKKDLSKILRPRVSPLLTKFKAKKRDIYVWTTFSADQVDFDYREPNVLLQMTKVMLLYLEKGLDFVRLDATTYVYKQLGTNCAHRPEAHAIVKYFRVLFDIIKPNATIVNETNVPHHDNISYFGNGYDEAQMVYNFPLPPLTMHTFIKGDCTKLANWAKTLSKPSPVTAYFNFLDSHDGFGVLPAKGILTDQEIKNLVKETLIRGGLVNYRTESDGSQVPYELNITLYSFLNPQNSKDTEEIKIKKHLAARALALSLRGVPGVYFHGLIGSTNDKPHALETGINRDINRENLKQEDLQDVLENKKSRRSRIFNTFLKILTIRSKEIAFHPAGGQKIILQNKAVFSLIRTSPDKKQKILCLINITNKAQTIKIDKDFYLENAQSLKELISGKSIGLKSSYILFKLEPYQTSWWKVISK
ncbi:MAG: sugar phosphorylase [Candidatus Moranbacteria bacterium]|nr:sugar phosphorylase [Candidatus Moranbacteria bacterium]